MKLGFVSAILPEYTLEQVLSFAHEAGFSSVELMCWPPGKAERRYAGVTHIDVTRPRADRDRAGQDLLQVRRGDLGAGLLPESAGGRSAPRPRACVAHLRQVIDAAAALGVGVVNTFIGRDPCAIGRRQLAAVPRGLAPAGRSHAEGKGVRIGIENCPMLFTSDEWPGGKNLATSPAIWRRMFDDIPSPSFGLNFDPVAPDLAADGLRRPAGRVPRPPLPRPRQGRPHRPTRRSNEHGVLSPTRSSGTRPRSRTGRRPLGRLFGALTETGYDRPRRHRGRGSSVRRLAREPARVAHHQPSLLSSLSGDLIGCRPDHSAADHDRPSRARLAPIDLSVLIPVYNEVDNVAPLHAELDAVLKPLTLRLRADLRR